MVGIFNPASELLPPWTKELYLCNVYCCPSTFSLTSSPPSQTKCTVLYIQTVCVCGGVGGGVLNCPVDHILQEFYTLFLTRFRTYKIASPPQTKMTSADDIKGLVSLKFLHPWFGGCDSACLTICWPKLNYAYLEWCILYFPQIPYTYYHFHFKMDKLYNCTCKLGQSLTISC